MNGKGTKYFVLVLIGLYLLNPMNSSAQAQPAVPAIFRVGNILVSGNRVTRQYIIERELPFHSGDSLTLSVLLSQFVSAKIHLINTRLFNDVIISVGEFRGYTVDIRIDVKERWYIFPLPYVRPVDRNFTAWAEQNYSLKRLDYGLRYSQYNFSGRNDYLRIWLITGYSRQIEFSYDHPYGGKDLKQGFGFSFLYDGLQELNVITSNNQQVFVDADTLPYAGRYMRTQVSLSLRYYFRPAIRTRHFFRLGFNQLKIDSAVTVFNQNYFNGNRTSVFYPELSYVINYNNIDYVPYPLKGFLFEGGLLHRGINADMNLSQAYIKTNEAFALAPKTFLVFQNMALLRVPFNQPYYNQQMIGYGDFYMRGLEKYVIDGVAGGVARNTIAQELFNFNIPFLRGTSHDHIPFRVYAKAYADLGYAYNKYFTSNSFTNRGLYSEGFGVDVVTFYDFVFRFEYSFNQFGEKGFFFHIRNDF
jgi:outer membrane protein assembly factor BamA